MFGFNDCMVRKPICIFDRHALCGNWFDGATSLIVQFVGMPINQEFGRTKLAFDRDVYVLFQWTRDLNIELFAN